MQALQARRIIQALVQGIHPQTGTELPSDSVLQEPLVIRALLAALLALEESAARAIKRARLPSNAGRPWKPEEIQALLTAYRAGASIEELASRHARTLTAIESRLELLGLLRPEERVTRDRFAGRTRESLQPGAPS